MLSEADRTATRRTLLRTLVPPTEQARPDTASFMVGEHAW
jgi:hypothetical protein